MQTASPPSPSPLGRLRIGTSGYSYPEWGDAGFYPPGTPAQAMLSLYAAALGIWYQV